MKIIGIVAVAKDWAIGKKNGLLFNLPADMKHFRETTSGHFVVMGVNTVNSLPDGKPLKNRITICIDQEGKSRDDCFVVKSTEECLALLKEITTDETEVYICGGGYCYHQFLNHYDEVIVTKVDAVDKEATVFFPNLDKNKDFIIAKKLASIKDGEYKTRYITYERIK